MTDGVSEIMQSIGVLQTHVTKSIGEVKTSVARLEEKVDAMAGFGNRINDLESNEDLRKGRYQTIKWLLGSGALTAAAAAVAAWFHKGN